jgi:4-hydroxybutyryl-CoA dehydratase/vinylacetyl-CoA-Delta-isomerase
MHGGGSPDGAKLVVRFATPMEEYVDYARKIINIEEPVPEPKK